MSEEGEGRRRILTKAPRSTYNIYRKKERGGKRAEEKRLRVRPIRSIYTHIQKGEGTFY